MAQAGRGLIRSGGLDVTDGKDYHIRLAGPTAVHVNECVGQSSARMMPGMQLLQASLGYVGVDLSGGKIRVAQQQLH